MADSTDARMLGFALLLLRTVLGVIVLYYGLQDVFALMGGEGFYVSSQQFAQTFGVDDYVGQIVKVAELVAGVFLLLGFLTRYAALIVGAVMAIGAAIGAQTTESLVKTTSTDPLAAVGYPTTLTVMAMVLIMLGGGLASLDARMQTKRRKAKMAQIS